MTALTALSYMKRLARDCRQNEGIRIQWGEKVFASFLISVFFMFITLKSFRPSHKFTYECHQKYI